MLLSRYLILGTDGHGANTGNVSRMTDQEVLDLDLPGRRGAGHPQHSVLIRIERLDRSPYDG
jgi:hypothetical protein